MPDPTPEPWTSDGRLKPHAIPAATTHDLPSMTAGFDDGIEIPELCTQEAATVDPAVCPRCKGDNREAFRLCPGCAEADGRLLCPSCHEDVTDYDKDDLVYRTDEEGPYCSGECVRDAIREEHHG